MSAGPQRRVPVLVARDVSVVLGGNAILSAVDLEVCPGELLVLVGPNGAGKSTLLGVLAGDVHPTSGAVTLDDHDLTSCSASRLARQRAVQLQQQGLSFGFRVREVVAMGRAPWHRVAGLDDDAVVDRSMQRADVTHLAERRHPTLSGGEQARTTFARVLAQDTPLMMLDEPTASLDIGHQEALLATARACARAGGSVVAVLHDLSLAAAYADRVCLLSGGTVRALGPPTQVLTAAAISEVYDHEVEVLEHAGGVLVVPVRRHLSSSDRSEEVRCTAGADHV